MKPEIEISTARELGLSIDYTRRSARIREPIRVGHVTDTHLCSVVDTKHPQLKDIAHSLRQTLTNAHPAGITPEESFSRTVTWMNEQAVDIVVLTGDIVHFPDPMLVQTAHRQIRAISAPVLYCPGNHDWHYPHQAWNAVTRIANYDAISPLMSTPIANHRDGFWRHTISDIEIVVIDNSMYQFSEEHTTCINSMPSESQVLLFYHIPVYSYSLTDRVLKQWDAPIMVDADHLWTERHREKWLVETATPETKAFLENLKALDSERVLGAFCGHVHFSHEGSLDSPITQYVTNAGFRGGARIVDIVPG